MTVVRDGSGSYVERHAPFGVPRRRSSRRSWAAATLAIAKSAIAVFFIGSLLTICASYTFALARRKRMEQNRAHELMDVRACRVANTCAYRRRASSAHPDNGTRRLGCTPCSRGAHEVRIHCLGDDGVAIHVRINSHRQAEGGVDSETNRLEASSSVPIGFEVRYSLPGRGSEAIVNVSRSNVDDNGAEVGGNLQILVFVRSYSWSWQPRICELTAPRTRSSARVF